GGAPDPRAGPARSSGNTSSAQVTVGRGHRGRADAELVGQVPDRGKPVARVQLPVPDARLHAGRYLLCGTALDTISYQYVHSLYCNILLGAAEPASGRHVSGTFSAESRLIH